MYIHPPYIPHIVVALYTVVVFGNKRKYYTHSPGSINQRLLGRTDVSLR